VPEDLPPEDDEGNIEYKFNMCGINMAKVVKRTTQMAYRLFVSDMTAISHSNGDYRLEMVRPSMRSGSKTTVRT